MTTINALTEQEFLALKDGDVFYYYNRDARDERNALNRVIPMTVFTGGIVPIAEGRETHGHQVVTIEMTPKGFADRKRTDDLFASAAQYETGVAQPERFTFFKDRESIALQHRAEIVTYVTKFQSMSREALLEMLLYAWDSSNQFDVLERDAVVGRANELFGTNVDPQTMTHTD